MTSATALVPLWDRAAEWERRLAMIRDAQSFLYLSTFYIELDARGTAALDALLAAQRRGVAVNLLIDGFGQRLGGVLMSRETRAALAARLQALRAAGAVVTFYRPAFRLQRWLGGGQHVKIQVSEAGEAIFGSSNLTESSFDGWNEYSVALRGPVTATLLESYRAIGGHVEPAHLVRLRAMPEREPEPSIVLDYWLCNPNPLQGPLGPLGWRGRNEVTERLIDAIDAARASVCVSSFYFKPVEALLSAFIRAARRGVQVEVFHSHRNALPQTDLAWIAAAVSYDRLMEAGVTIWENRHGEHSKIVTIDGTWAAFGSYNFEDAAHDRLAEAMLVSRDPRAVEPTLAIFDGLRRDPDNAVVSAAAMATLPRRVAVKRRLFGPFKRWM